MQIEKVTWFLFCFFGFRFRFRICFLFLLLCFLVVCLCVYFAFVNCFFDYPKHQSISLSVNLIKIAIANIENSHMFRIWKIKTSVYSCLFFVFPFSFLVFFSFAFRFQLYCIILLNMFLLLFLFFFSSSSLVSVSPFSKYDFWTFLLFLDSEYNRL